MSIALRSCQLPGERPGPRPSRVHSSCNSNQKCHKNLTKQESLGKLLSPERRLRAVIHASRERGMSERRACQLVNQPRGTQRYQPTQREDEDALTRAIIELASQYGRYGYRRITVFLQRAGLASVQGPGRTHLAPRGAEGSP